MQRIDFNNNNKSRTEIPGTNENREGRVTTEILKTESERRKVMASNVMEYLRFRGVGQSPQ